MKTRGKPINLILRPALALTALFTLLTGVLYPLAVTGVAQSLFARQAHGSLVERDGQVIGSELIAQGSTSDRYFHPRPSAAGAQGYDASASGGSNLGPTSKALIAAIGQRAAALHEENPTRPVPLELVTASGSGLDPHLSPAAAHFEVPRVARARGLSVDQVQHEVDALTEPRALGLYGERRVNVLRLNLALDRLRPALPAP